MLKSMLLRPHATITRNLYSTVLDGYIFLFHNFRNSFQVHSDLFFRCHKEYSNAQKFDKLKKRLRTRTAKKVPSFILSLPSFLPSKTMINASHFCFLSGSFVTLEKYCQKKEVMILCIIQFTIQHFILLYITLNISS